MGIEYRLRFTARDEEAVAAVVRQFPEARATDAPGVRYEFSIGASEKGWPQATLQVEPGGAYFCDHCGGLGRAMLGEVVARLVSAFGAVTVEEL